MSIIFIIILIILIILALCLLISWYTNSPKTDLAHSMEGINIIITGGSRGIGWECAKELAHYGAKIILGCRDQTQALQSINKISNNEERNRIAYIHLDLANYDSIKEFAQNAVKKLGKIDILINNAGSCFQHFTLVDGIEKTFFTNYLGHFILSGLLLDHFNPKGKIINVSTRKYARITPEILNDFTSLSNLDFAYTKTNYNWMTTYVLSKLANVHLATYLGEYTSYKNIPVKVVSLHPGFINNRFFREIEAHDWFWFIRDTLQAPFRLFLFKDNIMGAQTSLHLSYMNWDDIVNGAYYKDCHFENMKEIGKIQNAKKMIEFTQELIAKNDIVKKDQKILKLFEM